jgi:hypothetical protein
MTLGSRRASPSTEGYRRSAGVDVLPHYLAAKVSPQPSCRLFGSDTLRMGVSASRVLTLQSSLNPLDALNTTSGPPSLEAWPNATSGKPQDRWLVTLSWTYRREDERSSDRFGLPPRLRPSPSRRSATSFSCCWTSLPRCPLSSGRSSFSRCSVGGRLPRCFSASLLSSWAAVGAPRLRLRA